VHTCTWLKKEKTEELLKPDINNEELLPLRSYLKKKSISNLASDGGGRPPLNPGGSQGVSDAVLAALLGVAAQVHQRFRVAA
jgi:hypothetical protein